MIAHRYQAVSRLPALGCRFIKKEGPYDKTVDVLACHVRLCPSSPDSYDSLAEACFIKGDGENAINFYRLAVEKNTGDTDCEK